MNLASVFVLSVTLYPEEGWKRRYRERLQSERRRLAWGESQSQHQRAAGQIEGSTAAEKVDALRNEAGQKSTVVRASLGRRQMLPTHSRAAPSSGSSFSCKHRLSSVNVGTAW